MAGAAAKSTGGTGAVHAEGDARPSLTSDLDVDVCVVGGGLAGLTAALEAARGGSSVAVLEAQRIGWGASGHHLGAVMPGFGVPIAELMERVGYDATRALWALAREGADHVRALAASGAMCGVTLSEGALEVSNVDIGDALIGRLQTLGEDLGVEVEGWQAERVRSVLGTGRYFHAIHYPHAFQIHGPYVQGLAALAEQAGVRIFEDTPVLSIDAGGIRKRVMTPSARLRCADIVLAGNVHLGSPARRLTATLLPVWRYAALTGPLGPRLAEVIAFTGSVADTDGIDQFRVIDGDRLLWASPETTWPVEPRRFAGAIRRRIATVFPALGAVPLAEVWSGVAGLTVHGMPQVGRLRPGLWVASGFGRQGLATSAMGGRLVARGITQGDDRWRLFSPFELVWAGGAPGRIAGQVAFGWQRAAASAHGVLARYRERARLREAARERARTVRIGTARAHIRARANAAPPPTEP